MHGFMQINTDSAQQRQATPAYIPATTSGNVGHSSASTSDDLYRHTSSSQVYARSTNVTYASCFGLPYQDHNYGAPPPPSPPHPQSVQPAYTLTTVVHGTAGGTTMMHGAPNTNSLPSNIPKIPGTIASLAGASARYNGHIDIENVLSTTEVVTTANVNTSGGSSSSIDASKIFDRESYIAEQYTAEDGITRCICDFQHDDGYMICCDQCCVWQHVDCMGVDRDDIPDNYLCEKCDIRIVDKHRAVTIQRCKRQEIPGLAGSSSTETENETNQQPILEKRKKKSKSVQKKERIRSKILSRRGRKIFVPPMRTADRLKKERLKSSNIKKKLQGPKRSPIKTRALRLATQSPPALHIISNGDESGDEKSSNEYSQELCDILANKKFNGQTCDMDEFRSELLDDSLSVRHLANNQKVLEVMEDVPCDKLLADFTGKIMLRNEYNKENIISKRGQKFVLFYSKFQEVDLCIDATTSTNKSRFIRRSCTPNCEVRHIIDSGKIHFYIYTLKSISRGAEITIPFDYDYMDGRNFTTDCACNKSNCPVFKARDAELRSPRSPHKNQRVLRMRSMPSRIGSKNHKVKDKYSVPLSGRKKKMSAVQASPEKIVSSPVKEKQKVVTSPVKSKSPRRTSLETSSSTNTNPIASTTAGVKSHSSNSVSVAGSTGQSQGAASHRTSHRSHSLSSTSAHNTSSLNQEAVEATKKMTREERKMEAIMKAIEKMEKREVKKKEAQRRTTIDEDPEPESKGSTDSPKKEEKSDANDSKEAKPKENKSMEEEEVKTTTVKRGRKKSKSGGSPRRRRVSTMSGTRSDVDLTSSCDEGSQVLSPPIPSTPTPVMDHSISAPQTPNIRAGPFRFHKTKKHYMNEWLHENDSTFSNNTSLDISKPLSIHTESPPSHSDSVQTPLHTSPRHFVQPAATTDEDSIPSPISHMRRHSTSATSPCSSIYPMATSTPSQLFSGASSVNRQSSTPVESGTDRYSAKKRWLRQAMTENAEPPPPLKKRCLKGSYSPTSQFSTSFTSGMLTSKLEDNKLLGIKEEELADVKRGLTFDPVKKEDPDPSDAPLTLDDLSRQINGLQQHVSHSIQHYTSDQSQSDNSTNIKTEVKEEASLTSETPTPNTSALSPTDNVIFSVKVDVCDSDSLNDSRTFQRTNHSNDSVNNSSSISSSGSNNISDKALNADHVSVVGPTGPKSRSLSVNYELEEGEYVSGDETDGRPSSTVSSQLCNSASVSTDHVGRSLDCTDTKVPVSCHNERRLSFDSDGRHENTSELTSPGNHLHDNEPLLQESGGSGDHKRDFTLYQHSGDVTPTSSTRTRSYSSGTEGMPQTMTSVWLSVDGDTPITTASQSVSNEQMPVEPAKKKVSLLEYRKRMKSKTPSGTTISTHEEKTTDITKPVRRISTTRTKPSKKGTPTLAPLPLFESAEKNDEDGQWFPAATTVERIREQSGLSLTERLKREFGVDASESDDEGKNNSEDVPPPPPPPLPTGASTLTNGGANVTATRPIPFTPGKGMALNNGVNNSISSKSPLGNSNSSIQSQIQSTLQNVMQQVQVQQAVLPSIGGGLGPLVNNSSSNRATSPTPLAPKIQSQQFVEALTQLAAHTSSLVKQSNHKHTGFPKAGIDGSSHGRSSSTSHKRRDTPPPPPPPPRRHSSSHPPKHNSLSSSAVPKVNGKGPFNGNIHHPQTVPPPPPPPPTAPGNYTHHHHHHTAATTGNISKLDYGSGFNRHKSKY